jgi:hypothetical protein
VSFQKRKAPAEAGAQVWEAFSSALRVRPAMLAALPAMLSALAGFLGLLSRSLLAALAALAGLLGLLPQLRVLGVRVIHQEAPVSPRDDYNRKGTQRFRILSNRPYLIRQNTYATSLRERHVAEWRGSRPIGASSMTIAPNAIATS